MSRRTRTHRRAASNAANPPAPRSATASTCTTRPCATAPSARASATRWPTSSRRTAPRRARVGFIEGGWPGALPKDTEFFARAAAGELELRHAALVAFGATRKAGARAEQDPQVRKLLDSQAPVVTLVAKSDRRHIERALRTDVAENRAMVADTVALLRAEGRRVFLDASTSSTATSLIRHRAGCAGRGGQRRRRRRRTVRYQRRDAAAAPRRDSPRGGRPDRIPARHPLPGRHRMRGGHSVAAVQAGASHVQCTANGYGERAATPTCSPWSGTW